MKNKDIVVEIGQVWEVEGIELHVIYTTPSEVIWWFRSDIDGELICEVEFRDSISRSSLYTFLRNPDGSGYRYNNE